MIQFRPIKFIAFIIYSLNVLRLFAQEPCPKVSVQPSPLSDIPTGISTLRLTAGELDTNLRLLNTQTGEEVNVGDIEAGETVDVTLPPRPAANQAVAESTWQVVDASGATVEIQNDSDSMITIRERVNTPPKFSPIQLTSVGAMIGETTTLLLFGEDADGDTLTFSKVSGPGSVNGEVYNYRPSGPVPGGIRVDAVVLRVSDGKESEDKSFRIVVNSGEGVRDFYADMLFTSYSAPDQRIFYDAVHYLTLKGVLIGFPEDSSDPANTGRIYKPQDSANQAETLAVMMKSAALAGLIDLEAPAVVLPRLIYRADDGIWHNFTWLNRYLPAAEALGLLDADFELVPHADATREWTAGLVAKMMALDESVALLPTPTGYSFTDESGFSNTAYRDWARQVAYAGYMGRLGNAFSPSGIFRRQELALVAAKFFQLPSFDALSLDNADRSVNPPAVLHPETFEVTGLERLATGVIRTNGAWVDCGEADNPEAVVEMALVRSDGTLFRDFTMVSALAGNPIAIDSGALGFSQSGLLELVAVLRHTGTGVQSFHPFSIQINHADADGDGVANTDDLWPEHPDYTEDANNNGIPDAADSALGLAGASGDEVIVVNGRETTLVNAILTGTLPPPGTPEVTIEVRGAVNIEGDFPLSVANVIIRRTGPTTEGLHVDLVLSGTATENIDFTILPETAYFRPGFDTIQMAVEPVADGVVELKPEWVQLRVVNREVGAYNVTSPAVAELWFVDEVPSEIELAGNGMPIPNFDVASSDTGTDFGSVSPSAGPVESTITISNTGTARLDFFGGGAEIVGNPAFTLLDDLPDSLAPEESVTLRVRFDPSTTGMQEAELYISSGDVDERFYVVQLQGMGEATPPTVVRSPEPGNTIHGAGASLSAYATGDGPFSYQWFQGPRGVTSSPVGNNSPYLDTDGLEADAQYWVRISNSAGSVDSEAARVQVEFQIEILETLAAGSTLRVFWNSFAGQSYEVFVNHSLNESEWMSVKGVEATSTMSYVDFNLAGTETAYFRVELVEPPLPLQEATKMVSIPAGTFEMGDTFDEGYFHELPVHSVSLSPYEIGAYEVTASAWQEVRSWANTNGYDIVMGFQNRGGDHPVRGVTWEDVVTWCNAKSEKDGLNPCYDLASWTCDFSLDGWRLPTEAEWEKAARGGVPGQRFPHGNTISHEDANYESQTNEFYDVSPTQGPHPDWPKTSRVGSFAPNGYGLYDMAGNAGEWVYDWYDTSYYRTSPAQDPTGPSSGETRMIRGGTLSHPALIARVTDRLIRYAQTNQFGDLGFRLARGQITQFELTPPGAVSVDISPSSDGLVISWTPVSGASFYHVGRSTSPSGSFIFFSDGTSGNEFEDSTAERGLVYYYVVRAEFPTGTMSGNSAPEMGELPLVVPKVWSTVRESVPDDPFFYDIVSGPTGQLLLLRQAKILTTSNGGSTWATNDLPNANDRPLECVYNGSQYVAVGQTFDNVDHRWWRELILDSTDGINWRKQSFLPEAINTGLRSVSFGLGKFVAVGTSGAVLHSSDGLNWVVANSSVTAHLDSVVFTGIGFLGGGSDGTIIKSSNGITWEEIDSGLPFDIEEMAAYEELIVARSNASLAFSADAGETWSLTSVNASSHQSLGSYGSHFMLSSTSPVSGGGIWHSKSETSPWSLEVSVPSLSAEGITSNGGRLYFVTSSGKVMFGNLNGDTTPSP